MKFLFFLDFVRCSLLSCPVCPTYEVELDAIRGSSRRLAVPNHADARKKWNGQQHSYFYKAKCQSEGKNRRGSVYPEFRTQRKPIVLRDNLQYYQHQDRFFLRRDWIPRWLPWYPPMFLAAKSMESQYTLPALCISLLTWVIVWKRPPARLCSCGREILAI